MTITEIKEDTDTVVADLLKDNVKEVTLKPTEESFIDSNIWADLIGKLLFNHIRIIEFVPCRYLSATADEKFANIIYDNGIYANWRMLK